MQDQNEHLYNCECCHSPAGCRKKKWVCKCGWSGLIGDMEHSSMKKCKFSIAESNYTCPMCHVYLTGFAMYETKRGYSGKSGA